MDMLEKVYEILQINQLDESQQEDIKSKIDEVVEMKAKEIAKDTSKKVNEEIKEELQEEYEKKFEDYKNDITSKFSNFLDEVLEQELQIPEKVYEYAKKGELYYDVMEQLKSRMAIEEGVLDDEVKGILKEAKEEITDLKKQVNKEKQNRMELQEDAKDMATDIYLRKKCDGLPEKKKEKMMNLLEDAKTIEEIDRKFDLMFETIKSSDMVTEKKMYCKECGTEVDVDEESEEQSCPECSGNLTTKKEESTSRGRENVLVEDKLKNKDTQSKKGTLSEAWLDLIKSDKL